MLIALFFAVVIKTFWLQAFYIPSGSMESTLQIDDRVLVNKMSYRVGDIGRGDIVVFEKPPSAPGEIDDFIKRVIALPGETVTFVDGAAEAPPADFAGLADESAGASDAASPAAAE